jgi:hypothetical protein
MLESPLARGTGIAAFADVTAPSTRAATAGILKLDTFMAFTSHNGASSRDVTSTGDAERAQIARHR